jgi:hypothetical protein
MQVNAFFCIFLRSLVVVVRSRMVIFCRTAYVVSKNLLFVTSPFVASSQHIKLSNHLVLHAIVAGEVALLATSITGYLRLV